MSNDLCSRLGIEYPIFAFTHCRDVVVEVSKAGGIGVFGAVGFTAEQLKEEKKWAEKKHDMQLLINTYKLASKDRREIIEVRKSERKLQEECEDYQKKVKELGS